MFDQSPSCIDDMMSGASTRHKGRRMATPESVLFIGAFHSINTLNIIARRTQLLRSCPSTVCMSPRRRVLGPRKRHKPHRPSSEMFCSPHDRLSSYRKYPYYVLCVYHAPSALMRAPSISPKIIFPRPIHRITAIQPRHTRRVSRNRRCLYRT